MNLDTWPNGLLALTHGVRHGQRKTLFTIFGGTLFRLLLQFAIMVGTFALVEAVTELFIAGMAARIRPWLALPLRG